MHCRVTTNQMFRHVVQALPAIHQAHDDWQQSKSSAILRYERHRRVGCKTTTLWSIAAFLANDCTNQIESHTNDNWNSRKFKSQFVNDRISESKWIKRFPWHGIIAIALISGWRCKLILKIESIQMRMSQAKWTEISLALHDTRLVCGFVGKTATDEMKTKAKQTYHRTPNIDSECCIENGPSV